MKERLQKILARAGFGSRRFCETLITEGRVTVDGAVVRELGTRADPETAAIACDGRAVRPQRFVYYAMHKPSGVVCTNSDPQGRKTALDLLPPSGERVYCVGRLDEDSEGLLLVTNDGALCNLLTHPRYGVPKTYHVVVRGEIAGHAVERIQKGVWLSEGRTAGARVFIKKRARDFSIVEITVTEGMNREIRRVFAKVGHTVERLKRIRIGPIDLGSLAPGAFRPLSREEVGALRSTAERPRPAAAPEAGRREMPPSPEFRPRPPSVPGERPSARPPSRGPRPPSRGPRPPFRGPRPPFRGPRPPSRGPRPPSRGPRPSSGEPRPSSGGPRPSSAGPRPPSRGPRPPSRGPRPPSRGPRPPSRGPRFGGGGRGEGRRRFH